CLQSHRRARNNRRLVYETLRGQHAIGGDSVFRRAAICALLHEIGVYIVVFEAMGLVRLAYDAVYYRSFDAINFGNDRGGNESGTGNAEDKCSWNRMSFNGSSEPRHF